MTLRAGTQMADIRPPAQEPSTDQAKIQAAERIHKGKAAEKVFSLAGNLFDHLDRTRLTRRTSNSLLERDRTYRDRTYLLLTGQTFLTM